MRFKVSALIFELLTKNRLTSDERNGSHFPQWQDLECQVKLGAVFESLVVAKNPTGDH